jgi:putative lipoprotein
MKRSVLRILLLAAATTMLVACVGMPDEGSSEAVPATTRISGSALYRERIALPADAVFEATLEDVSRADAASEVLGRARLEPAGQPPFRFEIGYEPSKMQPGHSYAVRARVTQGDQLLFTTDRLYPLPKSGPPGEVQLMLVSAQRTSASVTSIENTYWRLVELRGKPVPAMEKQREPHILLSAERKRVVGFGGCNRLMGSYVLSGQTIKFSQLAGTMMACTRGMQIEQGLHSALGEASRWTLSGSTLELSTEAGTTLARFEK